MIGHQGMRRVMLFLTTGRPGSHPPLSHQNTVVRGRFVYLYIAPCPCGAQYSVLLEANAVTGPRPADRGTGLVKS